MSEMPLSSLPLDPHEPGGAIQPNLPQRTPGCEKCGLALMFPVKGEGVLVGLLADGEQCKLLKLHKAGDGAVDDG
jgi:hypothetical protein